MRSALLISSRVCAESGCRNNSAEMVPALVASSREGRAFSAAITATGKPGLLLFGPHIAVSAGTHTVNAAIRAGEQSKATLRFAIASHAGTVIHATAAQSLDRAESGAVLIVSIPLRLDTDVADLEIKCELDGAGYARLEKITITSSFASARYSESAVAVVG